METVLRLSQEHHYGRFFRSLHKQGETSRGHHRPILPQLSAFGALRFGIRHRDRRTHRRTFCGSEEQLGRLDLYGGGHDRYMRSFFTIGPLLQIYVAAHVPGLKVAGWGNLQDVLLPAFTLGLVSAAYLARLSRGGVLEVLSQDFVRTAQAKGVSPTKIILKHTLRGGLLPAVAYLGPAFAALISGSFIVETIFQVPGMGQHFVNAATTRDEFLLLGLSLFFGFLIVVMNLLADLLTGFLDPRVRLGTGTE